MMNERLHHFGTIQSSHVRLCQDNTFCLDEKNGQVVNAENMRSSADSLTSKVMVLIHLDRPKGL